MSRGSEHAGEVLPFWSFPELRPSPRIRSLLDGVYQTSWGLIEGGLKRSFQSAQEQMRQQALAGRTDASDWQERRRLLQHCEPAFIEIVKRTLQHSLLLMSASPSAEPPISEPQEANSGEPPAETCRHREHMLLAQMSARAEVLIGVKLSSLAWRFAAIQSKAPAEPEGLVLGPYWLATALSGAFAKGPAHPEDRLRLLRCLDLELYANSPRVIEAVDDYLAEHRLLPRVERFLSSHKGKGIVEPAGKGANAGKEDAVAWVGGSGEPAPGPMPEVGAIPPGSEYDTTEGSVSLRGEVITWDGPATRALRELANQEKLPGPADRPTGQEAATESIDSRTVAKIWEFLGRRYDHAGIRSSEGPVPTASSRDVIAALHKLQQRSNRHYADNSRAGRLRDRDLRQALLNELREITLGTAPRLADADANVITLVGRLFGELLVDRAPMTRAHGLMARLEIPIAKAALLDKSFFLDARHRARAFLEAVVSACEEWIEDEEADRPVIERIEGAVDQLCNAYETDDKSFDLALDELEKHLGAMRKRAEITIRRHVEGLQGREKLQLARIAASEIILACTNKDNLPTLVEQFLKNAWADSIALAILRYGIDSDVTCERAKAAKALALHFNSTPRSDAAESSTAALEAIIKEGLGAVGLHSDTVHSSWRELTKLERGGSSDSAVSAPYLNELARSLTRLGGEKSPEAHADTTPAEFRANENGKSRAHDPTPGQWLDIHTSPRGRVRRFLAWKSQVSHRILLTDRRGVRVDEYDWEVLLASISANEATVRTPGTEGKVSQALRNSLSPSDPP